MRSNRLQKLDPQVCTLKPLDTETTQPTYEFKHIGTVNIQWKSLNLIKKHWVFLR